jgi:hypothetical protein
MTDPADLAVRLRRAAFNRALADADLSAIGPLLGPQTILVTGTDSAVLAGRKAQLLAWKREFAASEGTIYTRTPDTITTSPVEPIAMEHGHWQGAGAGSGKMLAAGTYAPSGARSAPTGSSKRKSTRRWRERSSTPSGKDRPPPPGHAAIGDRSARRVHLRYAGIPQSPRSARAMIDRPQIERQRRASASLGLRASA